MECDVLGIGYEMYALCCFGSNVVDILILDKRNTQS